MAPELEVPCAVVTGGTDGIGKETALGLARGGYRVIVVGRDAVKGSRAARELRARSGSEKVEYLEADLSLAREADRLAGEIARRFPSLHRLVHSAGVVRGRREITEQGIESNFAVNYLGRFVLTERLLPLLLAAGGSGNAARVVIVGGAARGGKIHFEDVNLTRRFGTVRVVRQFCEANDVFTVELARRLAATGAGGRVTVTSLKL
ncbi:MAG TPA: SDR family NAD(P)-dependent oxidoreductase, partial [Verrucomicrobiae bacterium]|nr:SDR family NAD(P)-dependent oxidoreductase [Verrucomicrobiae bacterium]